MLQSHGGELNQFGKLRKSAILLVVVVPLVSDRGTGIASQQGTKMKIYMRKQARVHICMHSSEHLQSCDCRTVSEVVL